MVGISRSAYYKYKDHVQLYEERDNSQLGTLYLRLMDEPGMLSQVLKALYENGANILTVNQNIPVDGAAIVTISIRINCDHISMDGILENLAAINGVVSVKRI